MSDIAEATGIGRATLYKYFLDVETILSAWHQRQVEAHLAELGRIQQRTADPITRLQAVLRRYADICRKRRRHGNDELAAVLHRSAEVRKLQRQLRIDYRSPSIGRAGSWLESRTLSRWKYSSSSISPRA
jgi:AcrR family transcriptional regulator